MVYHVQNARISSLARPSSHAVAEWDERGQLNPFGQVPWSHIISSTKSFPFPNQRRVALARGKSCFTNMASSASQQI